MPALIRSSLASVLACCALAATPAPARAEPTLPYSTGDVDAGSMALYIHRGGVVPFELTVIKTPDDCSGVVRVDLSWNKKENWVKLRLRGHHVLYPHPDLTRTEGVDWFPNPFWPEPQSFQHGRYQFWIVSAAGPPKTFYYDAQTLNLVGSELDMATPPPGTIPVQFPTLYTFPIAPFQPDADGNLDLTVQLAYDKEVRGDFPKQYAHHDVTFAPPNLCLVNPNRIDLSNLRGYIGKPHPIAEARPWSDYLRGGLIFDLTVEPPTYFTNPPLTTLAATYSGTTAIGGGVPKDWTMSIDAAFQSVAPPIKPWNGAGECRQVFTGLHTKNINFCQGQ